MKNNLSKLFYEKIEKIVYKILENEKLLQSEFRLGKVDTVVNSTTLKCFIDGSTVSMSVPCNPDVKFNVGDEVFVKFVANNPVNKFVPYKRGIPILDTTPPNEITNLTTSNLSSTTVTLSWTASTSTDIASYDVWQGATLIGSVTHPTVTYNVTGLTASTQYLFTIKSKDTSNNISSGVSKNVTTTSVADTTPPNNVSNLSASNITSSSATLNWTASTSTDVASYDIYNGSTLLGNTTSTTYNVTGLSASTSYTFYVKAKDLSNNVATGTSVPVTTSAASTTIATSGLVGYWNAKQGLSGTTWNNIAPATSSQYAGTLTGVTIQANGAGAQFDGSTSKVDIPYNSALTDMTFEFWVTPDTTTTGHCLFGVDGNNRFIIDSSNYLNFKELLGGTAKYTYGVGTIPTNTLTHVAVRITGNTVDLFINGVKDVTNTSAGAMTWGTSMTLGWISSGYYLKGLMHVARLYNRALTDAEISSNKAIGTAVGL